MPSGDLTYRLATSTGLDYYIRHYDVRFEPDAVRAIIGNATSPKQTPPDSTGGRNQGGAPPKAWWDDFWIEICGRIYDGDLKPEKQADLERAMHDWAVQHGHDVGETTIKNAAWKLFKAWNMGSRT